MAAQSDFLSHLQSSLADKSFVKLTFSKAINPTEELKNIYVRQIDLKDVPYLSFTYHYNTKDETRNFELDRVGEEVQSLLNHSFKNAALLTTSKTISLLTSKKGKRALAIAKASDTTKVSTSHDRQKNKRTKPKSSYLQLLGVTDMDGNIIPKMADKYRQINKFLEVMEAQFDSLDKIPNPIKIVDMGCGKGYLTFALYEFLTETKKLNAQITGIELRQDLVDHCNEAAKKCGFSGLTFENKAIEAFDDESIDVLIALHACDTATDDAIAKGLKAKAELIVCAPCCHKQVRQQLKGKTQENPLLKYGIFKERQFEMVTDTIRALILEKEGYESKVFEFVSNEHTRKNIMLVGINHHNPDTKAGEKIAAIKVEFGINYHQLEKLV